MSHRQVRITLMGMIIGIILGLVVATTAALTEGSLAAGQDIVSTDQIPRSIGPEEGGPDLAGPEPGNTGLVSFDVDGVNREALITVPAGEEPDNGYPVIMMFHGYKDKPEAMQSYSEMGLANAIVVYGKGLDASWQSGPYASTNESRADEKYVRELSAGVSRAYSVDRTRFYAVGFSNGGGFTALLGCRMPEIFAATAVVSGAYYEEAFRDCSDSPMPELDIHGTNDQVMPFDGGERHGTPVRSIPDVLSSEAERNRCRYVDDPMPLNDRATKRIWRGCTAPVHSIVIDGGGHNWPGHEIGDGAVMPATFATVEILRFFNISLSQR